jgi:hypothetical protein
VKTGIANKEAPDFDFATSNTAKEPQVLLRGVLAVLIWMWGNKTKSVCAMDKIVLSFVLRVVEER